MYALRTGLIAGKVQLERREVEFRRAMEDTVGMVEKIREPIVDSLFYPSDPDELKALLFALFANCEKYDETPNNALAIVSPHAGYNYCGHFAASAFHAASDRKITTAVIMSPVHREPADAIYLSESDAFSTPLGPVSVDRKLVAELEACSTRIFEYDIPHLEEHAIEVQLPFLQYLFPNVQIVPLLMGRATLTNVRLLAGALNATFQDRMESTLFVISSNLSTHTDSTEAVVATHRLIALLENRDFEEIIAGFHRKDITACGSGLIAALLCTGIPNLQVKLLSRSEKQADSDDTGSIIHYGALAFYPSNCG